MLWLLCATHALAYRPAAVHRPALRRAAVPSCSALAWECSSAEEAQLVQLCAKTDRGQRCTEADKAQFASLIAALEGEAPATDATLLNGRWRLLYSSEAVYRSSPFFSAFRQASSGMATPLPVPSGGVERGDPVSEAVYAITDAIPFYELGPAEQVISGVCSDAAGCPVPDAAGEPASDGGGSQDEPSDGGSDGPAPPGSLVSRVEIRVSRLFGLPPLSTFMTTASKLAQPPPLEGAGGGEGGPIDVLLTIESTSAADSTLAALLPPLGNLLENFPSGAALEAARRGSATVRLRTTHLSSSLRISRAVLDLADGEESSGVFVFSRESD